MSRYHHPPLKKKMQKSNNFSGGRKVPGSTPSKAAEIHSSLGEKQKWWALSRVTAALEAAGLCCHFRSLAAHTHLNTATWIPSSHGGQVTAGPPARLSARKEEGPPSMQDALSKGVITKKREREIKNKKPAASSHPAPIL